MPINEQRMQPWQVFQACRKHVGANVVAMIFGREIRSAYSWAQDPAFTMHRCRCPLEMLHALFTRMDAVGIGYAARAGIEYLATALDQDSEIRDIQEPLPTIQEEILADYSAVSALQAGIEAGLDIEEIKMLQRDAVDEIERTVAKYIKDRAKANS